MRMQFKNYCSDRPALFKTALCKSSAGFVDKIEIIVLCTMKTMEDIFEKSV